MSTPIYVGIDPGLDGAVAWILPSGILQAESTPTYETGHGSRRDYLVASMRKIHDNIIALAGGPLNVRVGIEKVHSMPKQGVAATFSFGMGYGIWRGIFADCSVDLITPQAWAKIMLAGCPKGKSSNRAKASELFPVSESLFASVKKGSGLADASLIAKFLMRMLSSSEPITEPVQPKEAFSKRAEDVP